MLYDAYHKVNPEPVEREVQLLERFFVRVLLPPRHGPQAHLAHDQVTLAQLAIATIQTTTGGEPGEGLRQIRV